MRTASPQPRLPATLGLADAARQRWDVVVAGAGPAGALAAREIARGGAQVLLVDRATFPRWKVCGCCLNGSALAVLKAVGLESLLKRNGARPLHRFQWHAGRRQADLRLPAGVSLSREAFDAALVASAIEAGAEFLPGCLAILKESGEKTHRIALTSKSGGAIIESRVALAADGLTGRLLRRQSEFASVVSPNSRIGVAAVLEEEAEKLEEDAICMAWARGGYVGLVRLEDGRLNLAAAIDPCEVSRTHGPAGLISEILRKAGLPIPRTLAQAVWRGTPPLTRRLPRVAGTRLFILGDAAGYVEPFTGEGIAWALTGAALVAPLALRAADSWTPDLASDWDSIYQQRVGRRQRVCRAVRWLLRTSAASWAVSCLALAPWLVTPFTRSINHPSLDSLTFTPGGVLQP